jgi:hypothetical protein
MAGLLSLFGQTTGDPNRDAAVNQGLLQAGLAMLQGKGNFGQVLGQGGQAGVQGYQSAQDRQFQANQQEQQKKKWQQEQEALQRQRAMQELAKKYYLTPEQASLQNGKGPTLENAAKIGSPSFDFEGYANALAQYDPVGAMELRQRLAKPTRKLTTVGPGGSLVDEANGQVVYSAPAKDDAPSAIKEYQFAVGQGYKGSFADWDKERRKAGASSVSVNNGQKGFDNTLKLRGDFRSEPIYKAHQEMQSAYAQIQQSLKQNSPAGDLAGATKVMKLLDPGSVVRESELGMAMQASGLLDRVQHYATNVLNGTKLTPAQRKDFQKLADALYGESVKQYNSKRGEYQGIAQRNGLNEEDVLGNPSAAPSRNVVNFNDLK